MNVDELREAIASDNPGRARPALASLVNASPEDAEPLLLLGLEQPSLGAEDFAELQRETPSTMFRLGVAGSNGCTPLHSNTFAADEASVAVGVEVLSASLLRWLERAAA